MAGTAWWAYSASQKDYDDKGFEVRRYSADLWINIYVSYEQCQKRMENAKRFIP